MVCSRLSPLLLILVFLLHACHPKEKTVVKEVEKKDTRKTVVVLAAYDMKKNGIAALLNKREWNVRFTFYDAHESVNFFPGASYHGDCPVHYPLEENEVFNCGDQFAQELRKVDYVVNMGEEKHVYLAAKLREQLDVKTGLNVEVAERFYDKLVMKKKISEKGILTSAFAPLREYEEFMKTAKFPLIIKVRTEAGSKGIYKVESEEQVHEKVNELRDVIEDYLIEEFITGDIYSFDGLWKEGKLLYGVPIGYDGQVFDFYQKGKSTGSTIISDESFKDRLEVFAKSTVKALDFDTGVTHLEIIREKGTDKIFFMEIAARKSGTTIHEQLTDFGYLDIENQSLRLSVDMPLKNMKALGKTLFGVYRYPENSKTVTSIGFDRDDVVLKHNYKKSEEPQIGEKFQEEVVFYFKCEWCDEKELYDQFKILEQHYKIETEE